MNPYPYVKVIHPGTMNLYNYIEEIKAEDGVKLGYRVKRSMSYYSKRYGKIIVVYKSDLSDGATGVPDINSFGWIFHDELCATGQFADGTKCTNLQASAILGDILKEEGHNIRRYTWFIGTWLFGGGKARDNGMW